MGCESALFEQMRKELKFVMTRFFPKKKGSSRDLGEVEVDRQGAGKLAVSKHTTTITLLSPCIILILPPSGQVIPSSPKRFLPTITPCLPLSLAPTSCPVVADACNPRH